MDVAGVIKATGTSFGMSYGRFEGTTGGTTGTRILPLSTSVVNTGGLTLASNEVTVSKAGVYLVFGYTRFDTKDSSTGNTYLYLYKNGASDATLSYIATVLGTGGEAVESLTLTGGTVISLVANDKLSLYIAGDTQTAPAENRLTVVQLAN